MKKIDSVIVQINDKVIKKFGQILPVKEDCDSFARNSIIAKHDVVYSFEVFAANTSAKEFFFSNDLGYVPEEYAVSFNDSLKIVLKNVK